MTEHCYSCDELVGALDDCGPIKIEKSETGCMVFTEYGARLLGLFPDASKPNLLWVHKNLNAFCQDGDWLIGGDRLWIAPERHFYYENPRDFEGFHVQAGLDPGSFSLSDDLLFNNSFSLIDYSTNELCENCLVTRRFEPIFDPFHSGLAYAGVRIHDAISVGAGTVSFAPWSITQVYTCGPDKPGTAFFPFHGEGSLLGYFGPIPVDRADVDTGVARFRLDGDAIYKCAIAPENLRRDNTCRAVYVSPLPGDTSWFCVIKRSADMPVSQDDSVDFSKADPDGLKGVVQSYNNGPGFRPNDDSRFGEIEIQFTKSKSTGENNRSAATHELLGYVASRKDIIDLAADALGAAVPLQVY